jgi:hypothetical protein
MRENLNVPWFGTVGLYLCINKTDKPLNIKVMNTDNALAFLSSLSSSDSSYRTLVDMINDMDLEIIATQQL